jgi:hypothetical protein
MSNHVQHDGDPERQDRAGAQRPAGAVAGAPRDHADDGQRHQRHSDQREQRGNHAHRPIVARVLSCKRE